MDYTKRERLAGGTVLHGVRHFEPGEILECGQCFRWRKLEEHSYAGIAFGRRCTVTLEGDRLLFPETPPEEFDALWRDYFDFGRDYGEVKERFSADEHLCRAMAYAPGMRVLRQEPWEALCTFILSQNNNIARIRGTVERLCEGFGEKLKGGGFSFPTPQRLAAAELADLQPLRSGYRAAYILDAARMVASGELHLAPLYSQPLGEARTQLRRIRGVGPKVAECALLYGFGRVECLPVDVWIGRALRTLYPQGFPEELLPLGGLAQQYLFHYVRTCPAQLIRD